MRHHLAVCLLAAVMALVLSGERFTGAASAAAPAAVLPREACAKYAGLPNGFPSERHAGMVQVPAAVDFTPGSWDGYLDERPGGRVSLQAFWIDRTEVTNAQFAAFVRATGYVTQAERDGGSAVFQVPPQGGKGEHSWWQFVNGANWRHPEGPQSSIAGQDSQPVVQVTQSDAMAYATWLGRSLPTEAQWEWAARGGGRAELLDREPRSADGKPVANYWQGIFPDLNTREDGYAYRAPVGCFPSNGYGLNDMIGNVWEWTTDRYKGPRQTHGSGAPDMPAMSLREGEPLVVIKGGSFLCSSDYCARYRSAARYPLEVGVGTSHVGFRTMSF